MPSQHPAAARQRRPTWPFNPQQAVAKVKHDFLHVATTTIKANERLRAGGELEYSVLFLGIAARFGANGQVVVAFSISDGTYNIDFAVQSLGGNKPPPSNPADYLLARSGNNGHGSGTQTPNSGADTPGLATDDVDSIVAEHFIRTIHQYSMDHNAKFYGVGITQKLANMSPQLSSRFWSELDIVPLVFGHGLDYPQVSKKIPVVVDEEADSMARKCSMYFGFNGQPRLQVGFQNIVEVDVGGHARMCTFDMYKTTVHNNTWMATMHYANQLRKRNVKIVFFNTTPQGGGVALMRHALIRFFRIIGVDCTWYVPKPKPEVFRITKTNHNILQGVADPSERLTKDQEKTLDKWASDNADRFWLGESGPLRDPKDGGADVIIVDDPQMPILAKIAKEQCPSRPVIFRSHIQVRADLADKAGTPTSEVWKWIWERVSCADIFISHPVREFIPDTVDFKKVGYMPATTCWLDGLNKPLADFDLKYFIHEFNMECRKHAQPTLECFFDPPRQYIVQIARFDPAKGIPDVLASYAHLRRHYMKYMPIEQIPQLVIAGHGAIDDPDASLIYSQTLEELENKYTDISTDVIVMRVGPTDQILNALMSKATVALQLSTREGFEIKVSEALHKGVPIIASKAGGIPLQVIDGQSGFMVEPSDYEAVAKHLHFLFTNPNERAKMSRFAATHVSDEVGTVGNALAWMYLADALSKGEDLKPNSAWINDLARDGAKFPYGDGETKLPRKKELQLE